MQTAVSKEINGMKFKYFISDLLGSNSVGKNEEWEPHIFNFVRLYNSTHNCRDIVDVGANFGYHTLFFSRECTGNVHAFEPQVQNFGLLNDNVEINNTKNIVTYNNACGEDNSEIKMPIINDSYHMHNMGDITPNLFNGNNYSTVKSVRLDDIKFSSNVDLIKIDVQGWEKKVLKGAVNLLRVNKPVLIVEFENFQLQKTGTTCKELFDYIRDQNYYIFYLEYQYPCDHVCVHNDNLGNFRLKFKDYIFPHTCNNDLNNNLLNGVNEKISEYYTKK